MVSEVAIPVPGRTGRVTNENKTAIMDLNVKPLRCFIALAEEGSFTAAANRVHMTQPSFSTQIRTLEQAFGFALFERTTRRVHLTSAGAALLPAARQMACANDQLIRMVKSLARTDQNRLSIGAALYTATIGLRNELIEVFGKLNPDIRITVDARVQTDLMPALENGELDLSFILAVPVSRAEYDHMVATNQPRETVYPDDLPALIIAREQSCLQVPANSPLAEFDEIPLDALRGSRIVGLSEIFGAPVQKPINRLLTDAGAELVFSPEPTGVGIERYGRTSGIPALSLGWLHEPSEFSAGTSVRRRLQNLHAQVDLALICGPHAVSEPGKRFWDFVSGQSVLANAGSRSDDTHHMTPLL